MSIQIAIAGAAAACLLACGAESRPAAGPQADSYFPMVEGSRSRYRLATSLGALKLEVMGRGQRELPPDGLEVFVMDERNLGPDFGFDEIAPVAYLIEEGFVARIEGVGYDGQGGLRRLGQADATRILPVDPVPGTTWNQSNRIFATPEGGGAKRGWVADVRRRTSISVPAGTFDDVVEVVTAYFDESVSSVEPKVVYTDFYARGVGLVKSISEDASGEGTNRIEQVLLEYRFPAP